MSPDHRPLAKLLLALAAVLLLLWPLTGIHLLGAFALFFALAGGGLWLWTGPGR